MPPVNQGNKAALITWTVVATVFGITMAVLALIAYTGQNEAEVAVETQRTSFGEFASDADLQNARFTELRAMAKQDSLPNVYNLLSVREERLARLSTGATRFEQAEANIQATLDSINGANASEGVQASNLLEAVNQLQARLTSASRDNQALRQQHEALQARLESEQGTNQQMIAAKDEEIARLSQQLQETQAIYQDVLARTQDLENRSQENITGLSTEWETKLRQAEDRISQITRQLASATEERRILTEENRRRFNFDQMIADPDGRVLMGPIQGRLTINLGRNHGITNGMTFQVYDPVTGIPKATSANPSELPRGKGSIQVISVDPNSSEARIVNEELGKNIRQGDLIANLAYDRNVPVRFRVYGDFDLDHDGVTQPSDRDRIMTLVREFRGRLVDDVTIETDVLVMGKEPEVPRITEADLLDPIKQREHQRAVERRDAYMAERQKALDLNVPILNQNQFLYYIGYFDQVRR